ncbi:ESPR-type extended signal peptide-containing protein [Phocoenobacter skyensis]|uniref:ESPR-type extended signal peptide-containing protein n=1 Tax=Phocoenobacter skyensis TaxID=97481 RepID=A0A1H7YA80_9PAST|nr:ESPR-type extended signal peptide-containing protein [Pasteurella skyensis]MDP8078810.1 ESPR-type extended signal peptide-containing protein [Pasteurella skyensis]MDP8085864.1 ESPR-type extended signal peptide-containing protein [Pasteurella skyensis]MDP8186021.1 ESPR-type extended signal peptide-containing protein [Pasteurella skyensis]QLB22716.1 hypothetical protein A6B44_05620 [Pasteurella skyensis]SEM42099.1 Head domain of trimeric autotransporter adhesin [Pasteurella skyensis]
MNSIYKIVFNKATQTFTAVSELAKGATKTQSQSIKQAGTFLPKFAKITLAISMVLGFSASAIAVTDEEFNALKQQVEALKAQKTYVHVNNGTNTGTGDATINLGDISTAAGAVTGSSIAIGRGAIAGKLNADFILDNDATNQDETITTNKEASVAIGEGAKSTGFASIAIGGSYNRPKYENGVLKTAGIGAAEATGDGAVALGNSTKAEAKGAFAVGLLARAAGEFSSAIGYSASATAEGARALGIYTEASGVYSTSMGYKTTSSGSSSLATGAYTTASWKYSVAMGLKSKAVGNGSLALGGYTNDSSDILEGGQAYTAGSMALGTGTVAGIENGTEEAVAMGYRAKAVADNTLALGFDAKAEHENSVALGSNAETKAFTQVDETEAINGLKYKDFTGFADGVVSVGKDYHEKQIINVAPGKIAQTSTDAINGSQLFATNKAIGNVAKSVKNNFGGNAALNEDGNITFTNIGGTGKGTIHEAIGDIKTTADAAKRKTLANSTTLNNKADKNAGNLGAAEVNAWTTKLNTGANITAPTGKLVTDSQVKTALDTKLDADDITSKDKTVTIDTTTTAGKVDLKVNLDGTTLTKDGNGVISLADNAVTTAKILDGKVTKVKLAGDVTNILDKVGAGAVADGNTNTVTGDVVKTYVDTATAGKLDKGDLNVIESDDITVSNAGDLTKGNVKLSLKADKVKELAGTTDLATTYLNVSGANVGDKVTFGGNVGTATLANTTELAQIKAVKAVDDKVTGNTQTITNLGDQITNVGKTSKEEVAIVENSGLTLAKTAATANKGAVYTLGLDAAKVKEVAGTTTLAADLAAKANKDASNLTDGDKADWKRALDLGNVLTSANLADRLLITGSNVGSDDNKVKLGKNVGKGEITGETTQLVQEKAVKTYVDTAIDKVGKAKDGKDGHIGVDGKDGKDGSIGLSGKDGITVKGKDGENGVSIHGDDGISIKGEDGKTLVTLGKDGQNGVIGLQGAPGKNGADGKFYDISIQNGKGGLDGTTTDRIVYVDKATGDKKEVATLDDGLAFQGNDASKKVTTALNGTLVIEGQKGTDPAKNLTKDSDFAADNIFVDTTDGKLEIKLAKKLQGVEGIGIAGKDGLSIAGKDGANGLNGKDGENAVAINGKDGISIKGKDGKDGVSIKGEDGISIKGKDGMDGLNGIGLNGKDGITVNGKDGKDGKDSIAINGKDGISIKGENGKDGISIKGEDGIAVNGKNGKDGVSIHGDDGISIKGEDGKTLVTPGKDGQNGVIGLQGAPGKNGADGKFYDISIQNGKDGLDGTTTDRIVYVDKATGEKRKLPHWMMA